MILAYVTTHKLSLPLGLRYSLSYEQDQFVVDYGANGIMNKN